MSVMIGKTGGEGGGLLLHAGVPLAAVTTPLDERLPAAPAPSKSPQHGPCRVLRPARTPAGVLTALALTCVFGLVAAEAIAGLLGAPLGWTPLDDVIALGETHTWTDAQLPAIALAAAGTLLLLLAVLPGRPRLVPLETADPLTVIGITRAGLRRTLRGAAQQVDGVEQARVWLRRGSIEVVVRTGAETPATLLRQVGTAVGDRLTALGALDGSEIAVRVRRKGN